LRQDAEKKPGGDVFQAKAYLRELRGLGVVCESGGLAELNGGGWDVAQFFNLDRPIDNIVPMRRARERGWPSALCTIHHPRRLVDYYQRRLASRPERLLRLACGGYHRWEVLKDGVRVAKGYAPLAGWTQELRHGQLKLQQEMLRLADAVQLIANSE